MLEKEAARKKTSSSAPSPVAKAASAALAAEDATGTATATGPNRQRRRPRKLNKEPVSTQNAATTSTTATGSEAVPSASTAELDALKSRVRGLEAKVEELYKSTEARTGRSPRRRGKGRKGSSATQIPTVSTVAEPAPVVDEEEADEELVRLENELEVARRDLEIYQPRTRPRTRRSASGDTEYVEEIPRDNIGATEDTVTTGDRQVTLTGSYRIPLPSSVSVEDVKSIQSGVSAAQNVAKSFLEKRRAAQAAQASQNPKSTATPKAAPKASSKAAAKKPSSSMEVSKETDGQSWSEWFGGYSMAISRAVKNIEAEAAIESQRAGASRPAQATRTASAPSTAKRAAAGGTAAKGGQRPGMKSRQGNMSNDLLS